METVRLRSKVGPLHCTWRPTPLDKLHFDWTFDNNLRCEVPARWWESIKDSFLDSRTGVKYKQALVEL